MKQDRLKVNIFVLFLATSFFCPEMEKNDQFFCPIYAYFSITRNPDCWGGCRKLL